MSALALRKLRSSGGSATVRQCSLSSSSIASCHFPNVLGTPVRPVVLKQGRLLKHIRGTGNTDLRKLLLVGDKVSTGALDTLSFQQLQVLFDNFEQKYNITVLCDFVKARTQPLPHESILPLLHVVGSQRKRVAPDFVSLFQCEDFLSKVPMDITHLNHILNGLVEDKQTIEAFRVLCSADQAFGPALRINSDTFGLLAPYLAQSDSWESIFFLLARLHGAGFAPSLPAYEILLRECAKKPLVRWVYAKQFLYDIVASAAGSEKKSRGIKVVALLALNTILAAGRSGEVVLFFRQWEKSKAAQALLCEEELLQVKAFAAAIRSSPHCKDLELAAVSRITLVDTLQSLSKCSFGGDAAAAKSDEVCRFALNALLSNTDSLYSKPVLMGAAIAAVLTNVSVDSAEGIAELHQLWRQLSSQLQQSSSSSEKRHEVLTLLSKLALSSELDVSAVLPITSFLRTLLREIEDGAADPQKAKMSVAMSPRLGDLLIEAFGMMRDGEGITLTLLRCEEQDVLLSDKSFNIAGTIINEAGDHKLLIGLFELRAKRIVKKLQQRRGPDGGDMPHLRYSLNKSSHVFVPVLKAFARLNDLESMMQLVMVDMQEDMGIAPRCSLLVILINSLLCGGRAADAEEVIKRNLASADITDGSTIYHPMVEALLNISLRVAAEQRNGELALRIFSQAVVDSSRNSVGDNKSAEMRMAELACLSLGSRETVHMIPMLLSSLMQSKESPLLLSDRVLATVLSVAVACQNHEVFKYGLGLSNKNKDIRIDADGFAVQLRAVCLLKHKVPREQVLAFLDEVDSKNENVLLRDHSIERNSLNL